MSRLDQWKEITSHLFNLKQAAIDARLAYDEYERTRLRPGERYPGVSLVMLRDSPRSKYKRALVVTPNLYPHSRSLIFTNNKSARILSIEFNDNPEEPFLWITIQKHKRKLKEV